MIALADITETETGYAEFPVSIPLLLFKKEYRYVFYPTVPLNHPDIISYHACYSVTPH
jgi:hypothetical protein